MLPRTRFKRAQGFSLKPIVSYLGTDFTAQNGTLANSRSSTATVVDYEGIIRNCKAGEIRYSGGRRVDNLLATTKFTTWHNGVAAQVVTLNVADIYGTFNAVQIVRNTGLTNDFADFTSAAIVTGAGGNVGKIYNASLVLYTLSNTAQIRIAISDLNYNTYLSPVITITSTPTRYSFSYMGNWSALGTSIGIGLNITQNSNTVIAYTPMLTHLTNSANQNPPEFIDSNTIYNAGVPGVKYFDIYNGNTVSNNIVTESVGAKLPVKPMILAEPAATNYTLQSNTPATQTIALSAGTYTITIINRPISSRMLW